MDESSRVEDMLEISLYAKRGITLTHGEGVFLWDTDGEQYLDAMSNYGVNVLGHCHPSVDDAVRMQLARLTNCHQSFYNDVRSHFEETLAALLPAGLHHICYANSGTESIEAAIKFARIATGRSRIISAKHGYHGRTLGALSVTGVAKYQEGVGPLLGDCHMVPFNDLPALQVALPGAAAVLIEPIQGESGVHGASPGYLAAIRELCDETGVLFVLDEIQTGMGRTGRLFAFEHAGISPDVFTVSKGLANGLPIGVTVVSDSVAARIPRGSHGSTFAGNPLCCAAAVATLEVVTKPGFLLNVQALGKQLKAGLRSINNPLIREVRGKGLMVAVELKTRITPLLREMQRGGVLALPAGPRTIRLLPPLIVEKEHIETIVRSVEAALAVVRSE